MKKDKLYLQHILEAITKIEKYLGDATFEDLKQDEMMTDALARQLGIIGEAANQFSEEFRDIHPELPYQDMVSMRNFLVHEYSKVDRKTVWDTCKNDLPGLKNMAESALEEN